MGAQNYFNLKPRKTSILHYHFFTTLYPGNHNVPSWKFSVENALNVKFTLSFLTLGEPWDVKENFRRESHKMRFSKVEFDSIHPLNLPPPRPTVTIWPRSSRPLGKTSFFTWFEIVSSFIGVRVGGLSSPPSKLHGGASQVVTPSVHVCSLNLSINIHMKIDYFHYIFACISVKSPNQDTVLCVNPFRPPGGWQGSNVQG